MKNRNHGLSEKEVELIQLLMAGCETTGDIQAKLKKLFPGTIEQMLEAEVDEHLGYEKKSVPRDSNGEFETKVIEKRQNHTDEIEQKIMAMYVKGMSQCKIEDTLREIYDLEISYRLVSRITDKILYEVNKWQNRPLDKIYLVVSLWRNSFQLWKR